MLVFIVIGGTTIPVSAFNDDNVNPKIAIVEVGGFTYGTTGHLHDLHTPFDIDVYVDGTNQEDNLEYDWSGNPYFLFITWWHVADGSGIVSPQLTRELVSPSTVGEYKKYHFVICDQDSSIDANHDDMDTYYGGTGDTWSSFGGGKVFFYVYGYTSSDTSAIVFYAGYTSEDTPMSVTFVGTPDSSEPPLEPADEGLLVGLEDMLSNIAEDIGEVVSNAVNEISNNPILVPLVIVVVGGVIGVLFLARTGGFSQFMSKISPKPQTKKRQPVKRKIQKKTTKKKGGFFDNLMKPPKPTPVRRNRRKKR